MPLSGKVRVGELRKSRFKAGWKEARVWVVSHNDLNMIKEFAFQLRMKSLKELARQIGRKCNTPAVVVERAVGAMGLHDTSKVVRSTSEIFIVISDLARANQLADLNAVVEMLISVFPNRARYVEECVSTILIKENIAHRLDFRGTERADEWQARHPQWKRSVKTALANYSLEAWAETVANEMREISLE